MARVIVLTSGKGGVGKTTVTANLGMHLASKNYRVCLIDMDIGLNNLDVVMNMEERVVYTMIDVIEKRCRLKEALIQDDYFPLLYVLSSGGLNQNLSIQISQIKEVINSMHSTFDFVLIDCPAGIDAGFKRAISCANEALVVTTPHLSSIRDADKVVTILNKFSEEDSQIISKYMQTPDLEAQLDPELTCQCLREMKEYLPKKMKLTEENVVKQLQRVFDNTSRDKVEKLIKHERPFVKRFISSAYDEEYYNVPLRVAGVIAQYVQDSI